MEAGLVVEKCIERLERAVLKGKETRGQECVGSEVTPHASAEDSLDTIDSSLSMMMHASGPSAAPPIGAARR
jgi:hypothetical protein